MHNDKASGRLLFHKQLVRSSFSSLSPTVHATSALIKINQRWQRLLVPRSKFPPPNPLPLKNLLLHIRGVSLSKGPSKKMYENANPMNLSEMRRTVFFSTASTARTQRQAIPISNLMLRIIMESTVLILSLGSRNPRMRRMRRTSHKLHKS